MKKPQSPAGDQAAPATNAPLTIVSKYWRWNRGEDFKVGRFFNTHEFQCPCGCSPQIIAKELVSELDQLRSTFNAEIKINSGYRCQKYQADLKARGYETAAGVSQHELGNAADIAPLNPSLMVQLKELAEPRFLSIGIGKTFLHVDTRRDKIRRWTYASR